MLKLNQKYFSKRQLITTIFCPNCGTPNRDEAELCVECGNVIPKYEDDGEKPRPPSETAPIDFGITTNQQLRNNSQSYPPPPPPPDQPDFGITVSEPAYDYRSRAGSRIVCERCGTVLKPDDQQCPSCGNPLRTSGAYPSAPSGPYAPVSRPSSPVQSPSYPTHPSPYPPPQQPQAYAPSSKPKGDLSKTVAKCAKCGAIVYDYETRCNNCGRILTPTRPTTKSPIPQQGKAPEGTARCSNCNAIVYPHQTNCPNCGKQLAPVLAPSPGSPSQRMSRCRRCGHLVYPTDSVCPNCGRSLDPVQEQIIIL